MKAKNINKIINFAAVLILGVISMTSCVTDVVFKGDITEPQLVVNAIAEIGQPLSVDVTMSNFVIGASYQQSKSYAPVKNAKVVLAINGKEEQLGFNSEKNLYVSSAKINFGDSLDLRVEANGHIATSSIVAISRIADAEVDTTDFSVSLNIQTQLRKDSLGKYVKDENGRYVSDTVGYYQVIKLGANVTIHDPANEHNYYMIETCKGTTKSDGVETSEHRSWAYWATQGDNQDLDDEFFIIDKTDIYADLFEASDGTIKEDGVLDGKDIRARIPVSFSIYRQNLDSLPDNVQSIWVEYKIRNVDSHYYKYAQSAYANAYYDEDLGLFVEPVQVYNNIQGGVGIFASFATDTHRVVIL